MSSSARFTLLGIVTAILLIMVASSAFIVRQSEQALVLQFGRYIRTEQTPGLKWKIPFMQSVEYYDARLLDFTAEAKEIIAADQKTLIVDAFVRYRITDPRRFRQAVGNERVLRERMNTILESSLRQALGNVPLTAIISSERAKIMQQVRDLVNQQVAHHAVEGEDANAQRSGFGIEVVDVRIVRADLPKENSESIYRRMQTEREREAKEFRAKGAEDAQKIRSTAEKERTILLAEARKKSEILRGEGDSEATRIFAEASGQDPEFYSFYRTLQAYRKTLTGKDTTAILSGDEEFLNYFEKGSR